MTRATPRAQCQQTRCWTVAMTLMMTEEEEKRKPAIAIAADGAGSKSRGQAAMHHNRGELAAGRRR